MKARSLAQVQQRREPSTPVNSRNQAIQAKTRTQTCDRGRRSKGAPHGGSWNLGPPGETAGAERGEGGERNHVAPRRERTGEDSKPYKSAGGSSPPRTGEERAEEEVTLLRSARVPSGNISLSTSVDSREICFEIRVTGYPSHLCLALRGLML